jgi:5-deoxy-glucuronate isomerase
MAKLIRASEHRGAPIVEPGPETLTLGYFNLVRLGSGEATTVEVPGIEIACTVLSGRVDIAACAQEFRNVGRRAGPWDGPADSVYCGTCPRVTLRALRDGTEIALAGALCDQPFAPFRVGPEEVEIVDIGSTETHTRRRRHVILGDKVAGRVGRLRVEEVFVDRGCWVGYPPHKHDHEQPPEESDFEEICHFRFRPGDGFAAQFCYDGDGTQPVTEMVRSGDTFLIDRGYHPTATAPGYAGYLFRVLAGRQQRALRQKFEPRHRHLVGQIPGVAA